MTRMTRLHGELCKWFCTEMWSLAFLRENLLSLLIWPIIAVCLGGLLWSTTLARLGEDEEQVKDEAFNEAASLSTAYAHQLTRSLEQIDYITLNVKHDWERSPGILAVAEKSSAGLFLITKHLFVTVVGRDGKRLASTVPGQLEGPSLADREYFKIHKNDPSKGLLINEPRIGHRTGKTLISFTRRLDSQDGSFNGVVIVSVEPTYLASFVGESSLNKGAFHTVSRSDGVLLGAKPSKEIWSINDNLRSPLVFQRHSGVVRMSGEKFAHNQARVIGWEKLANYPIVAIVGLSEQEIFASHRTMERDYHRMATAGSVLLLLLTLMGMFFSARLTYKKWQAEEVKQAYRLATDGAREGFFMVRPIYDQHKSIVDFVVEDCNECGAFYYGTTRTSLIGMTFASFWPGAYAEEIIVMFARVMETGSYDDEYCVPPESPLQVAWLQRRLVRAGEGLAVTLRDISGAKEHEEKLISLADTDTVTTLPNRHWLMHYLPVAIQRSQQNNTMLALLFVDLDDFKIINDTLGHAAGDEVLQLIAARLQTVIRPQDNVIRLGGDEFTIILEQVDSKNIILEVAKRINQSLSDALVLSNGTRHLVCASIGISIFPHDGDSRDVLLKHADIAMYAAKANGKARYQFYERQFSERLVTRLQREKALRQAIERNEFELYYQPRVGTVHGELRGMEALVRWNHPELGLVPPNDFIPIAEETGLIVQLGELVIEKACAQIAQWNAQDLPVVPVSVNVSPRQFNQGNVGAMLTSCMEKYDIAAPLIEIEITESCMMGEGHTVSEQLALIERLGVKLLVDDFGTGYSSLSQIKRLAVHGLKVDKAFTDQLTNGQEDEAFFSAIISMAHAIGMSVVAEGVETMEQLHALQALSCDEIQGYLISKPIPASDVPQLMHKQFLFSKYPLI